MVSVVRVEEDGGRARWSDPLGELHIAEPLTACLHTTCFLLVTLLLCLDIATDVWVTVVYGLEGQLKLLGICTLLLSLSGLFCGIAYVIQSKTPALARSGAMALCLFLNFPLQLGIITARFRHFATRSENCCIPTSGNSHDWLFTKLKMLQSIFETGPMMILNIYALLYYEHAHIAQYTAIVTSFVSLTASAALYEKSRKEHLQDGHIGIVQLTCIFTYKALTILARTLATAHFLYFFRSWLTFVILPHFFATFIYFICVYHDVWKVNFQRMLMHSLFCLLAFFPIHNEYRPEGEIMLYYVIFTVENVVMVGLPYSLNQFNHVHPEHCPGSYYYTVVTITTLTASALGMTFMAVYYFLLHDSRLSIRYSHFNWLEKCCSHIRERVKPVGALHDDAENTQNKETLATEPTQQAIFDVDEHLLDTRFGPPAYASAPPSFHSRSLLNDSSFNKELPDTDDSHSSVKSPMEWR